MAPILPLQMETMFLCVCVHEYFYCFWWWSFLGMIFAGLCCIVFYVSSHRVLGMAVLKPTVHVERAQAHFNIFHDFTFHPLQTARKQYSTATEPICVKVIIWQMPLWHISQILRQTLEKVTNSKETMKQRSYNHMNPAASIMIITFFVWRKVKVV